MGRLNRIFLGTGLGFLLLGAVWFFAITPQVLHSHSNFTSTMIYEATANTRAALTEPATRSHFLEDHRTQVVAVDGTDITLETSTTFTDLISNTVLFEDAHTVRFDRHTLKVAGSDALVRFPLHLEPRDYHLKQFSYFPESGVPFRFQGVERIGDHEVYRFDYEATALDWTANYGYDLEDTARIEARDWGSAWVDPSYGLLVQHTEEWSARVTGGAHDGLIVDEGRMWLSPDTIAKQLFIALDHQRVHLLYGIFIPIALAFTGITIILLNVQRTKR